MAEDKTVRAEFVKRNPDEYPYLRVQAHTYFKDGNLLVPNTDPNAENDKMPLEMQVDKFYLLTGRQFERVALQFRNVEDHFTVTPISKADFNEGRPQPKREAPAKAETKVRASKAAIDAAEEAGIDLATITGTGANSAITVKDVRKAIVDLEPESSEK